MKTMGLSDLRLVLPKLPDLYLAREAVALASGAADVLEGCRVFPSLPEALADVGTAWALSARLRELGPALQTPQQAACEAFELLEQFALNSAYSDHSSEAQKLAFVFGAERTGLTNEELNLCQRQVYIQSNPEYNSLNLSQAVQIVAYCLRVQAELNDRARVNLTFDPATQALHSVSGGNYANVMSSSPMTGDASLSALSQLGGPQVPNLEKNRQLQSRQFEPKQVRVTPAGNSATVAAVAGLHEHWLQAMEAVDFLNPSKPKKASQRLARLLSRVTFEKEEVDMLRGFLGDVIRVAQGRLYPHEQARLSVPHNLEADSSPPSCGQTSPPDTL